jgi:hypothetical protein
MPCGWRRTYGTPSVCTWLQSGVISWLNGEWGVPHTHTHAYSNAHRSFRATYRDARRHCTVHDMSYIVCLQLAVQYPDSVLVDDDQRRGGTCACARAHIAHTDCQRLLSGLQQLCSPLVGCTFTDDCTMRVTERRVVLYAHYPRECIGPVDYHWLTPSCVWLWTHAAIVDDVQQAIAAACQLRALDENVPTTSRVKCVDTHWAQRAFDRPRRFVSVDGRVALDNLQFQVDEKECTRVTHRVHAGESHSCGRTSYFGRVAQCIAFGG